MAPQRIYSVLSRICEYVRLCGGGGEWRIRLLNGCPEDGEIILGCSGELNLITRVLIRVEQEGQKRR